jgi:hypothetical protein
MAGLVVHSKLPAAPYSYIPMMMVKATHAKWVLQQTSNPSQVVHQIFPPLLLPYP